MPPPRQAAVKTSPLSLKSSPTSFVTATASPTNLAALNASTNSSSPDEAEAETTYRNARQLPPELKQHCQIYLEENLHGIALSLLNSTLASDGTAHGKRSKQETGSRGAYCPPPNQLAHLGTIIVHPDFTTRPREAAWPSVASDSLVYLRTVLETVGPINGRFKDAFRFGTSSRWSRGGSPDSSSADEPNTGGGEDGWGDNTQLCGKYTKESVWRRGQDFFSVVGWALNCSVVYPNRWEHWRPWLELVLDVLEADLHERHRLDREAHVASGRPKDDGEFVWLQESILVGYINQRSSRNGSLKHIIKAIFADGSKASSSVFQELWQKEHKGRSAAVNKRKREAVDLEQGNFGGWLDDESIYSSQASEPPTPQKRRTTGSSSGHGKLDLELLEPAYVESIALRQRLFALLSYLCAYLPNPPISLPDLYEAFYDAIKALPLPIFTAFLAGSNSALRTDSQITILQDILELYMPSSAIHPSKVDAERYSSNGTSPAILERCFLPYPANTIAVEDNARVGLLMEELVMLIWADGSEAFSSDLNNIVLKGTEAREAKVRKKKTATARGRGKPNGSGAMEVTDDDEARLVLEWSNRRLRLLATLIALDTVDSEEETSSTDDEMEQAEDTAEFSFMTARSS